MKIYSKITISIFALIFLSGCINSHGDPAKVKSCEDPPSVAIVPDDNIPIVTLKYDGQWSNIDLKGPAKGALKGTVYGLGFFDECAQGVSGDAEAFVLPLCFLAVPTGAIIGGLTGIYSDSTDETLISGDTPQHIIDEIMKARLDSLLTNLLFEKLENNSKTSFILGELDEKDHYYPIFSPELDAAMVVNVYSTDFIGYDDLWGDFRVIFRARAKLFKDNNGQSEVFSHQVFECKGSKRTLIEWRSDQFKELHQSLNGCLYKFASQMKDYYNENHRAWCQ